MNKNSKIKKITKKLLTFLNTNNYFNKFSK